MRSSGWAGRLRGVAVAAGLATALWTSTATPAQADWTAPQKVSAIGTETSAPRIAADDTGAITAAWVNGVLTGTIGAAFRAPGGGWQVLADPITTPGCHDPDLAVNASGAAALVADCGTLTTVMRAAFRPSGGSWGGAVEVPGSGSGNEPRVGIDASGNVTVLWEEESETVQSSYRPAGTGTWGGAQQVSPVADIVQEPQLAVEPTGVAVAVWTHKRTSPVFTVESASRAAGSASTWSATPKVLTTPVTSTTPVAGTPQIDINGKARSAVWAQRATAERFDLNSAWGTGGWGEDAASHFGGDGVTSVEAPHVGVDSQGRAVAVWRFYNGAFGIQAATTSTINGPWSSPVTLAASNTVNVSSEPLVELDSAGNGIAIWPGFGGVISAASRPAGGPFSSAVTISGSGGGSKPQLAMDPAGDGFAIWTGSGSVTETALSDNTPPTLAAISVPVSGKTGVGAAMSATGSDSWSSPVSVHWDFGDGTSADGAAVSHIYAAAGTKTVTVSATDAAGNSSVGQARQIVVTGSPAPGERLKLNVQIPKQTWKAIAKAKAVKLKCGLDAAGSCRASASLTGPVAKRLGLSAGKRVKVGSGSVAIPHGGRLVVLTVKLGAKARAAIAAATRNVPLQLEVIGTASGRVKAAKTRTLTIKRP